MKHSEQAGFTLLEILVAIAIVATVVGSAIPSYQRYLDRAARNDARVGLLKLAADQQTYFLRNGRYAVDLGELGSNAATMLTTNGRYRLSVLSTSGEGFVVRAALVMPDRERRHCAWFEMDQRQHKWAGPAGAQECWYR